MIHTKRPDTFIEKPTLTNPTLHDLKQPYATFDQKKTTLRHSRKAHVTNWRKTELLGEGSIY